jgi:hypothetical protein
MRNGYNHFLAEIITTWFFSHVSYQGMRGVISPPLDMLGTKERLRDENTKTTQQQTQHRQRHPPL